MASEHAGHRARMRERFAKEGLSGFSDHEILELILYYAIPQRDVNPLAHHLLNQYESLACVLDAPVGELSKIEGVGEYTATLLKLFGSVAREKELRRGERIYIANRLMAMEHCKNLLSGLRDEHFYVVCMDARSRIIANVLIARGTLDEVQAYPRRVVEAVMHMNAHCVVLCHNHPGGSLIPSQQDINITNTLSNVLLGIGVVVADHMIVADGQVISMVKAGLMQHKLSLDQLDERAADPQGEVTVKYRQKRRKAKEEA